MCQARFFLQGRVDEFETTMWRKWRKWRKLPPQTSVPPYRELKKGVLIFNTMGLRKQFLRTFLNVRKCVRGKSVGNNNKIIRYSLSMFAYIFSLIGILRIQGIQGTLKFLKFLKFPKFPHYFFGKSMRNILGGIGVVMMMIG